ncbi:MAG: rane protein [Labilithrix sp.]|nr:rane protein [Labilithrix sp.]
MKPQDVHLTDWKRILLGESPWSFTVEVAVRGLVLYVALLVALRVLGKRLSGQLTSLEMVVMISLGGIVSAPMVIPTRGILIGCLLLVCALLFLRGVGRLGVASERFEILAQGDTTLLVKDGLLVPDALAGAGLSRNALFSELRSKGFFHLGQLKRVYHEGAGAFGIFEADPPRAGLSLFPEPDQVAVGHCQVAGRSACRCCGYVSERASAQGPCPRCHQDDSWTDAVAIGAKEDDR